MTLERYGRDGAAEQRGVVGGDVVPLEDHITATDACAKNAGVPTVAGGELWRNFFKQFFQNGTVMNVFANRANVVQAATFGGGDEALHVWAEFFGFGEGRFDKGIYFSLPFDVMLPKYTERTATIAWQPLTRDGGARLQRQQQLYNITAGRDRANKSFGVNSTPTFFINGKRYEGAVDNIEAFDKTLEPLLKK